MLKEDLRRLNRETYGDLSTKVKAASDDLGQRQTAALLDPQPETFNAVTVASERWQHLAGIEEQFYCQKSKVHWMKVGDHNTNYFHRVAESKAAKNAIKRLTTSAGVVLTAMTDIKGEAVNYFKAFLQDHAVDVDVPSVHTISQLVSYRCSKAVAGALVRPVTAAEIHGTVFSMPLNKAPGPDGFTVDFFKAAWPIIGQDFVVAVQSFFLYGFMPKGVNGTILSLVAKITNPEMMKDFRPIACCNLIHKVISKLLAQRLKICLPEAIDLSQSAFVKGRLLLENVLLATELVKDYHKPSVSSRSAIKFDISKAFDTVQWSFLTTTLRAMHFPEQFIFWVSHCMSTASFSVSVNGELEGFFSSSHGLRQGCSLSPYLDVIASNVLSGLLSKAVAERRIELHPKCQALNLSHLSFADDIMVFTDGSPHSLHGMSGLNINVSKSSLFVAGRGKAILQQEAETVGLSVDSLPIRYLGLPLTTKAMTRLDYEPLLEKIRKRLASWMNRQLSYGGRLQLIKSVIASITNFWCSVFCLPKRCFKEIEGMCSAFLWSGSPIGHTKAKVAWEEVCIPKSEGGIGIRRLHEVSRVFGLSLIWRIVSGSGSLWVQWVNHYLIRQGTFSDARDSTLGSWQWRKLLKLRPLAAVFVSRQLGNGDNTFFWLDYWLPMGRLLDLVGENGICSLGIPRYAKVSDAVAGPSWRMRRSRNRALDEMRSYIDALPVQDQAGANDTVLWRHAQDVYRPSFSAAATWEQIRSRRHPQDWSKVVWFPQAVPRFAFITWLALLDRLSTGSRSRQWGCVQHCPFCREPNETRDHLFFGCPYSFTVWLGVVGTLLQAAPDPDWHETLNTIVTRSFPRLSYILLRLAYQATIYHIWRERNLRIHENQYRPPAQLVLVIDKTIRTRIMSLRYHENDNLRELLQEWFRSRPHVALFPSLVFSTAVFFAFV